MRSRRSVWSDPVVQQIAAAYFVPAAQQYGDLLRARHTAEGKLFQKIIEQFPKERWYRRGEPDRSRQCIAAVMPDGTLLDGFTLWDKPGYEDPRAVAAMLRNALVKWNGLSPQRRLQGELTDQDLRKQWDQGYPADGLVLRVVNRDLPSDAEPLPEELRKWWNLDYAWFRKDEVQRLLPGRFAAGVRYEVPSDLTQRIVAYHLLDNVHCHDHEWYKKEEIDQARLTGTVVAVQGDVVSLRFEGESKMNQTEPRPKGYAAKLLGYARYDQASGKFVSFEMLAVGQRHGGHGRHGQARNPGRMGIAFQIAGPGERTPPLAPYWKQGP
jgi:hypothetical protein